MRRYIDDREVGGRDPIDAQLSPVGPGIAAGRLSQLWRRRAALGLGPLAAPVFLFLPIGVALGPYGLNLLSKETLVHLDLVLPVALATLGVFVGLALDLRTRADRLLLAAANVESAITIVVVTLASWFLLTRWELPLGMDTGTLALILGVAASASSAGHIGTDDNPLSRIATRIADLDDVLPLVVGGVALALLRHDALGAMAEMLVTCALGLLVAAAGWLLFERAHSDAERGVFVIGAVTLIGGAPAYLGLSPLLSGLIAGLVWSYTPGRADQIIGDDLRRLQHPLVVILLIAAGASLRVSAMALWLLVPFVAFRLAGKLLGGWLGSRFALALTPTDLGAWLVPPGLIGLAFALFVMTVVPGELGAAVLTAVAIGTLVSELLSALVVPAGESL